MQRPGATRLDALLQVLAVDVTIESLQHWCAIKWSETSNRAWQAWNQGGRAPVWHAWLQARRPRHGDLQEEIGRWRPRRLWSRPPRRCYLQPESARSVGEKGACGGRASVRGRGGAGVMSLRTFASAWYPPKRVRFVGTPMSRHHRGITLLIGGEWARARVPSGVVARGNVWGQSSTLEVMASHLPPNARPSRKQCRRGVRAVAAGCSGGRRGAAGSGAPALARHCAVPVRRGWETGAGERHGHNQKCRVTKTILLSGVVD